MQIHFHCTKLSKIYAEFLYVVFIIIVEHIFNKSMGDILIRFSVDIKLCKYKIIFSMIITC